MECMDMEVSDEVGGSRTESINTNGGKTTTSLASIHLWYLHDPKGIKTTTLEEVDFKEISVRSLKEIVVQEKPEDFLATSINEIDILHNGVILEEKEGLSLESIGIKQYAVLHVIKKLGSISMQNEDAYKEFKHGPRQKISHETITELVIALKTMTLSPKFLTTIEKLGDPQTLKNVIAVVPSLQYDPIGISIIQDPSMIYYLADEESLKSLAETRPWVVEAFNFIAAGIHQQEATSSRDGGSSSSRMPGGLGSDLLSFVRQAEEDDDDDASPAEGGAAQQITRQQLVAALNSLSGFGILPPPGSNPSPRSAPPTQRQTSASSSTPRLVTDPLSLLLPGGAAGTANRPRSEPASALNPGTTTPPALTGELVARAMREALSQMPVEQRNAQLSAFRSLAMSLNQQQQQQSNPTIPPVPVAASIPSQVPMAVDNNTAPPPPTTATSQYQEELAQMRDLGIHDDNLSLTALRDAGGDVAQAVELIFSGYYEQ